MKILERGCVKIDYYQVRCDKCNSLLEFTEKDVQNCISDGDYVVCPVCGEFIRKSKAKYIGERAEDDDCDYK